jgi:hypothetical protein
MRNRSVRWVLLSLVLAAACGGSDDGGGDLGAGAGGGRGGDGPGPGGAGGSRATTSGGGGDEAGAGAGSAGSGGAGVSAGDGAGSGSAGVSAGDGGASAASCGDEGNAQGGTGGGEPTLACGELGGVCGECLQEKCCELAELCSVDADCACMATCIATQSLAATEGCLDGCGLTGSPMGFADFAQCAATTCPDGDECSVPSGFEPPPAVTPPPAGGGSGADIGSGTLADCSFGAADPSGEVLQLQSADGEVCVRVERRNDGPGSLENTSWTLLEMRVGPLGEVALIDDPSELCWYSSHHNFNDWAHAWSGTRHYDLKTSLADHGATPTYTLHVFGAGPLAAGSCSPVAEGSCPIAVLELVPAP